MAAIKSKSESNTALAALTSAALSLPGLHASAAVPATNIKTNASYGHYEESNNRMTVDVYHADAVIPLNDRIELAFSLDRDTYSGATPTFSIPTTLTNLTRYTTKGTEHADLISAASGTFGADKLTTPEGLDTFISQESRERDTQEINATINSRRSEISNNYLSSTAEAKALFAADTAEASNLFEIGTLALTKAYENSKSELTAGYNNSAYEAFTEFDNQKSSASINYNNDKSKATNEFEYGKSEALTVYNTQKNEALTEFNNKNSGITSNFDQKKTRSHQLL